MYRDSETLSATTKERDSQSLCDMQTSTSCNHTTNKWHYEFPPGGLFTYL